MQVELTASLTLPEEERSVCDYVTTIRGSLFTDDDAGDALTVGRLRAWKIHLERIDDDGEDPWEVLDAEHGELEALYSAVFDVQSGGFKPAVLRAVGLDREPVNIIAIHTVEIDEAYRGRRLGLRLVGRTLEALAGPDDMAALLPYPLDAREKQDYPIKRAQRRLSTYLQSAGFRPIPGSDWLVRNGRVR